MTTGHDSRLSSTLFSVVASFWLAHEAKFLMVVFGPFASEVILAKVKSYDEQVSVGLFDDMYIPLAYCMYIDQGEVDVRVEADEFYDDEPDPPKAAKSVVNKRETRRVPYTIIVCARTVNEWKMLMV